MSAAAVFSERYERKVEEYRAQTKARATLPRSEWAYLALRNCHRCRGAGERASRGETRVVCHCVSRRIFRVCLGMYRYLSAAPYMSRATYTSNPRGRDQRGGYGRKNEEYCADFFLIAKRTLDGPLWRVFELHFVRAAGWRECTPLLGMNRGQFFHSVCRTELALGEVFRDLRPYALFPVADYFS